MKKPILLAMLVVAALAAQGQRFDWVRTYTGQDVSSGYVTNRIVGSCVDREGNYYFLGQFSPRATLCGVPLLPDSVIRTPLRSATVVAKLSPQGTLLWHKAIYGTLTGAYPCALRQLGDTAFMIQAYTSLPYDFGSPNARNNLYYLDTLLTGYTNYPISRDSVYKGAFNAFITFRNDGTVIEQHFLCRGLLDTAGHLYTRRFLGVDSTDSRMYDEILSERSFCIDSVGNIYVLRRANDYIENPRTGETWSIDSGNFGALRIVVDGGRFLYCPVQRSSSMNLQIIKFSPHFDSILASTYIFDSTWMHSAYIGYHYNDYDFNMDSHGNIYLNLLCSGVDSPLRVSGSNKFVMDTIGCQPSVMIKYNSDLQPVNMAQLSFAGSGLYISQGRTGVDALLLSSHIDDGTNSVFVTGLVAWAPAPDATPTFTLFYNGDTIDVASRDGFWLRLDMDNLRLLSLGRIRRYNENGDCVNDTKLTTQHNRVFGQSQFVGGIVFQGTPLPRAVRDNAFLVWDYNGTELFGTTFLHGGSDTEVRGLHVIDSAVYLAGSLNGNATFGTISTRSQGASYAYMAKYVDTSFMTPYVMQDTRNTQRINWPQELSFPLSDSLVQLTATSTSGLPISYTCSDTSVARVEGATLRLLAEGDATVTASQDGNWRYHPAVPVTKPIHVGQTGIAANDLRRFSVYPNPAHTVVHYHSTHEHVKTVRVVSSQGRAVTVSVTDNQVDISALPSGIYYIQFVTEFNIYNHKIVKL